MSPRTLLTGAVCAVTLIGACPQVVAASVATPVRAQEISGPTVTPEQLAAAQVASATYADAQVAALSTQLNTPASIAGFANAMSTAGLLTSPVQAAALSPVQSVNTQTGAVSVPVVSRRIGNLAVNTSTGNATFTFSPALPSAPTCFSDIAATNTNYVFAQPVITSASATAVTYNVQAALKVLNISLGAATIWGPPPSGTTLNVTCITLQ